jgi:hypothetical protein
MRSRITYPPPRIQRDNVPSCRGTLTCIFLEHCMFERNTLERSTRDRSGFDSALRHPSTDARLARRLVLSKPSNCEARRSSKGALLASLLRSAGLNSPEERYDRFILAQRCYIAIVESLWSALGILYTATRDCGRFGSLFTTQSHHTLCRSGVLHAQRILVPRSSITHGVLTAK